MRIRHLAVGASLLTSATLFLLLLSVDDVVQVAEVVVEPPPVVVVETPPPPPTCPPCVETAPGERRCAPSAFIAGVPKAGSTTLWNTLRQHPNAARGGPKELNFWNRRVVALDDKADYLGRSAAKAAQASVGDCRLVMDASPKYFAGAGAAERIAAAVGPQARVIVLLRDPVRRILSEFEHAAAFDLQRPGGTVKMTRPQVRARIEAKLAERRRCNARFGLYNSTAVLRVYPMRSGDAEWVKCLDASNTFAAHSSYRANYARWTAAFAPEQLLFMSAEAVWAEPRAAADLATRFFGLPPYAYPEEVVNLKVRPAFGKTSQPDYHFDFGQGIVDLLEAEFAVEREWLAGAIRDGLVKIPSP